MVYLIAETNSLCRYAQLWQSLALALQTRLESFFAAR